MSDLKPEMPETIWVCSHPPHRTFWKRQGGCDVKYTRADHIPQPVKKVSPDVEEALAATGTVQNELCRVAAESMCRIYADLALLDDRNKPLKDRPNLLWNMYFDDLEGVLSGVFGKDLYEETKAETIRAVLESHREG